MGSSRRALSTLPRNKTCRPPFCRLYGTDRRDAKEPAASQLEWRVASEQEVIPRPVERIAPGMELHNSARLENPSTSKEISAFGFSVSAANFSSNKNLLAGPVTKLVT